MRLDPKLLKALEGRSDANEVLAEALGVCPTCGQVVPSSKPRPTKATRPARFGSGELKAKIIEYLTHRDKTFGNQTRCARALGVALPYVNRVWVQHKRDLQRGAVPQSEADE